MMPTVTYYYRKGYRYGFNGQEKDDNIKGAGNSYDFGERIQDPRLGRFLSVDPISKFYPFLSVYQYAANTPIWAIDFDGLEATKKTTVDENTGKTLIEISIDLKIKNKSEIISDDDAILLGSQIAEQLGKSLAGSVDENTQVKVNVNIINVIDVNNKVVLEDNINPNDFFIEFTDEVLNDDGTPAKSNAGGVAGKTDKIGNPTTNRFQVRVASFSDKSLNRSNKAIVRDATHEIGHGLGLKHPFDGKNDVTDIDQDEIK